MSNAKRRRRTPTKAAVWATTTNEGHRTRVGWYDTEAATEGCSWAAWDRDRPPCGRRVTDRYTAAEEWGHLLSRHPSRMGHTEGVS